ncbi:MAG: family 10 glycosylhydrolase [Clostridioides sp.]|jgi:uncharacterized lipoprotein YddW (UPF0748 family)/putative cell wall-binding protein|nr:family 10 glycosylhydrolase [Clostridioides sp.]
MLKKSKTISILLVTVMSLVTIFSSNKLNLFAETDSKEMRAAYISTVWNIDWPSTKNNQTKQKQEYTSMLDTLKSVGINAVVVQVRPKSDAIYKSSINPWSEYLTGTQGKDPGYDPLTFLIDEAHKRGMEFHAWFNPYRITTSETSLDQLAANHPARLHPNWTVKHNDGKYYYNPGLPEVKQYITDSVMEVVRNYNIDGVHFDDYFYPGTSFNDDEAYKTYGAGKNKDDWRRQNVNDLLSKVKTSIKAVKPNVVFGVSPSGIWRNKASDSTGSDTKGNESYVGTYADTRAWIKQGLVDYVVPQVYWAIGNSAADYSKLIPWWQNEVKGTNVDLYIAQGIYKQGQASYNGENVAKEIISQVELNRKYSNIKGSFYFSARDIVKNKQLQADLKKLYVENQNTNNDQNQNKVNEKVQQLIGADRFDTAVKISEKGWPNGADTVVIVNGNSVVDGITSTPLATTNNAPILLVDKDNIPNSTLAQLKKLNPSKVIFVGGKNVISDKVIDSVKSIKSEITTKRLEGLDRYQTALAVAKEIASTNDISKIYITSGTGTADAISIASKAGVDKQPIILTSKDSIDSNTFEWIKENSSSDVYFIGGGAVISDSVISKVDSIVTKDVSKNRVAGSDRQATNAEVIKKFYSDTTFATVYATESTKLVDALTSGPLAAKTNSPVVILGNSLSTTQEEAFKSKKSDVLHQIGGGVNVSAINKLAELLLK